jgi:hypothetical protein
VATTKALLLPLTDLRVGWLAVCLRNNNSVGH